MPHQEILKFCYKAGIIRALSNKAASDCRKIVAWAAAEDVLSKVQIEPAPTIIHTKQQAREIDGQHVEVLSMGYTDRIMINVVRPKGK